MKLTTVKEIYKERERFLDQKVSVGGWVRSVRGSKAFGFIVLHDGSCFDTLQIVYHDTMENFAEIKEIGNVFIHVLEDAGVYKCTPEGREAFMRFIRTL